MSIITLLAIILQSFWAKQLTLNEINKDKWLKSRRFLLFFLFKIGPLTSLVSAFTVVIVATLESEILGENLFFTFVSGWSSSVLVSIFFTPVLLLCRGEQQLTLSKRVFIIISSFLAFIAIGVLFKISQDFQQHERQDIFKQVKYQVVDKIKNEIKITVDGLNSLSAFFRSNKNVDLREFNLFTKQVFHHESSVRVLGWAPIINHKERIAFEKQHNIILEKTVGGISEKARERSYYAPIRYFYPYLGNEAIIGIDVLTSENQMISMDEVVRSKQVIASSPNNLIQDNPTNLGILFASAVFSDSTNNALDSTSDLLGVVIAVAQFKSFFEQISPLKADNIDLLIEDVTSTVPFVLFGKELNNNYRHVESFDLQVNTRQWKISLGEHQPWQLQQKNSQVWDILIGATFGGILFQILILMMVVYSNELSAQVVKRTRELIIDKEQSEKKNAAKTNFIHALSNELQTPLHAINNFSKQLEKASNNDKNKIIKNIQLAQKNMQKLLHMLDDLSKIESGKSEVDIKPFDFYGFLGRIDDMLLAKKSSDHNSITFLIDSNIPPFINSDELRVQQFLIVFCEEVHKLFNCKKIRLTVKVHFHHLNSATLLFVFTNHDELTNNEAPFNNFINSDIAFYSTQMAMAKEVCQSMNGDANLAISDSGERVLTASIKILITSIEQQYAYQSDIFIETEDK
jgi:CHASE1-domain containing sensor protein